jgi:hypothetical protein
MSRFFLFFPALLAAAPIGNPAEPALMSAGLFTGVGRWIKASTGYVDDYISNKRYVTNDPAEFDPDRVFKKFGLHSQMGTVSLVFLERIEFYGMFGGTKERIKWYQPPPPTSTLATVFDFQTTYHFAWQLGTKVVLLAWGKTYLGGDFSYFDVPSSHKAFFKFFNRVNLPMDSEPQKFNIKEWQGSLALSSTFWLLTPYAGASYLKSRLHITSGPENSPLEYKNEEPWGYFYGLTLSLSPKFLITGERRLRDEFAYTLLTTVVF